MRISLALLLLFGFLTVSHAADGTSDDPFPEEHDSEDAEDAEEPSEDGGEDEGEGGNDPLSHYEDEGDDALTEKHLRDLHKAMDHNKDGKVHLDEILKHSEDIRKAVVKKEIAGVFEEIESTKDGHLSLEEHMSEVEEFHEGTDEEKEKQRAAEKAKFKAADTNGDDKLDKEELVHLMHPETHPEVLEHHTKEEMRKRDTNKDGKLDQKEWEVDATHGEHQDPETHDPEADFKNLDENKDGFIDYEELRHWESGRYHTQDAMKKLLELADKDGDKQLTADELVSIEDKIEGHDAHPHLLDWVFHEEL